MLAADIGRAVAAARTRNSLTIEQLAGATGLDVELLSAVERGDRIMSTAKLDRVAAALGADAFALYEGRDEWRDLVVVPRATRPDYRDADTPVLARALERAIKLRAFLRASLGHEPAAAFEAAAPSASPHEDGYFRARTVRRFLGCIADPLVGLRARLAESFGIAVMSEALATRSLLAATPRNRAGDRAIVLNSDLPSRWPGTGTPQRVLVDRVSIAHELCHALFDAPNAAVDVFFDDPPRVGQARNAVEQRAGAFAAELLIPSLGLTDRYGVGRQIDKLSELNSLIDEVRAAFGTPAELAVSHLYNHQYVAQEPAFREELVRSAQLRPTKLDPAFDEADDTWLRVLRRLAEVVHRAGAISDGMARVALELEPDAALPWDSSEP